MKFQHTKFSLWLENNKSGLYIFTFYHIIMTTEQIKGSWKKILFMHIRGSSHKLCGTQVIQSYTPPPRIRFDYVYGFEFVKILDKKRAYERYSKSNRLAIVNWQRSENNMVTVLRPFFTHDIVIIMLAWHYSIILSWQSYHDNDVIMNSG
jgi:hypothetical protein